MTGTNVFYRIELSNPDDVFGDLTVIESRYVDDRDEITYSIQGLYAYTQYKVLVSVHNDVSDQDDKDQIQEELATTEPASKALLTTYTLVV